MSGECEGDGVLLVGFPFLSWLPGRGGGEGVLTGVGARFSAFDEPWKVIYNTPGKQWEDKWGLMDVDRNLKDGLVIPSCK